MLIKIPLDKINCVTTSPDGRFLVSGSEDASIKIFDLKTRQEVHHFEGVHKSIFSPKRY